MQSEYITPVGEEEVLRFVNWCGHQQLSHPGHVLMCLRQQKRLQSSQDDSLILERWQKWMSQFTTGESTRTQMVTEAMTGSQQGGMGSARRLGRYMIDRKVGQGGMGEVWLGRDSEMKRQVAIKLLLDKDPESIEFFMREASLMAQFVHPNLVTVFEVGRSEYGPYLVMQYVQGEDLKSAERSMDEEEKLDALLGVARALGVCHSASIIHRDIKPSNVMVEEDTRQVLLMDFGIGKQITADREDQLTRAEDTKGTPGFAPPEQFLDIKKSCAASDVYSWGVTAYKLLTGESPYKAKSLIGIMDLLSQALKNGFDSEIKKRLIKHIGDKRLARIIMKAMSPKIEDRYQDANDLVEEYEQYLKERRQARSRRENRRKMLLIGAMVLLVCVGLGAGFYKNRADTNDQLAQEAMLKVAAQEKAQQATQAKLTAEAEAKRLIKKQADTQTWFRKVADAIVRGRVLMDAAMWEQAEAALLEAHKLNPSSAEARRLLAQVCDIQAKPDSIAHYQFLADSGKIEEELARDYLVLAMLAVDNLPQSSPVEKQKALKVSFDILNHTWRTEDYYTLTGEPDPKYGAKGKQILSGVHLRVAKLLHLRHKELFEGASQGRQIISELRAISSKSLNSWVLCYALGFLSTKQRLGEDALLFLNRAANLNPNYPMALYYRQTLRRLIGAKAVELNPSLSYAQYSTALQDLERLQVTFSQNPRIDVDHADCLLEMLSFNRVMRDIEVETYFAQATQLVESLNTPESKKILRKFNQVVPADLVRVKYRAIRWFRYGNKQDRQEALEAVQRFEQQGLRKQFTAPIWRILRLPRK